MNTTTYANTQNQLLLNHLMDFYKNHENLEKMMNIINGESNISLRIVDWFVTNYSKKYFVIYELPTKNINGEYENMRFKVYNEYKLKLKAYSKRRFDPFCRWERINIPYNETSSMETTIGQLNFFKWAIENNIINYISNNYQSIEQDMNQRNSTSKKSASDSVCTRKKREELSVSACKCIKKETVKIVVKFT
jgi:hypothetical protein